MVTNIFHGAEEVQICLDFDQYSYQRQEADLVDIYKQISLTPQQIV